MIMKSNTVNSILFAVVFAVLAMVSAAVLSYFGGTGKQISKWSAWKTVKVK